MARINIIGRTQFGQSDGMECPPWFVRVQHPWRWIVQMQLTTRLIKEVPTGLTKGARLALRPIAPQPFDVLVPCCCGSAKADIPGRSSVSLQHLYAPSRKTDIRKGAGQQDERQPEAAGA